jgi:hypothetical protein
MDNNTIDIAAIIVIVLLVALAAWFLLRRRNTQQLRSRFGPEYQRAMEESGGQREAETRLQARAERVSKYHLHPLTQEDQQRYAAAWRRIQARFVDDPKAAADRADELLAQVMSAKGYPADDYAQRLEDLSVDHAEAVQEYRTAHDVTERHARGDASTEDMRQAMIHYRALFDELLGGSAPLKAAS